MTTYNFSANTDGLERAIWHLGPEIEQIAREWTDDYDPRDPNMKDRAIVELAKTASLILIGQAAAEWLRHQRHRDLWGTR